MNVCLYVCNMYVCMYICMYVRKWWHSIAHHSLLPSWRSRVEWLTCSWQYQCVPFIWFPISISVFSTLYPLPPTNHCLHLICVSQHNASGEDWMCMTAKPIRTWKLHIALHSSCDELCYMDLVLFKRRTLQLIWYINKCRSDDTPKTDFGWDVWKSSGDRIPSNHSHSRVKPFFILAVVYICSKTSHSHNTETDDSSSSNSLVEVVRYWTRSSESLFKTRPQHPPPTLQNSFSSSSSSPSIKPRSQWKVSIHEGWCAIKNSADQVPAR